MTRTRKDSETMRQSHRTKMEPRTMTSVSHTGHRQTLCTVWLPYDNRYIFSWRIWSFRKRRETKKSAHRYSADWTSTHRIPKGTDRNSHPHPAFDHK